MKRKNRNLQFNKSKLEQSKILIKNKIVKLKAENKKELKLKNFKKKYLQKLESK